jgi:FMN-dependent NADH-azoreductase
LIDRSISCIDRSTCNEAILTVLLSIEVSPRGERSISRALGKRFIEHWLLAHSGGTVVHRDLMKSRIPYMDNDWIAGVYAPPEVPRTPEMKAALDLSSELIAEVQAADHLVISTPMYNFSVPAILKSWLDYIVRPGFTFKLAPGWPGMLENKRTKLIVATRDMYTPGTSSEANDLVSPVLRRALAFMGITDVETVLAGGSLGVNRGVVKLDYHLAQFEDAIARAAQ